MNRRSHIHIISMIIVLILIIIAMVVHLSDKSSGYIPPKSKVYQNAPYIRDSLFVIIKDSIPYFYHVEDYR